MAGYGLGTVSSVNPLADTLQLSTRLLLEELWLCDDVGCVANSSNYILIWNDFNFNLESVTNLYEVLNQKLADTFL